MRLALLESRDQGLSVEVLDVLFSGVDVELSASAVVEGVVGLVSNNR